MAITQRVKIMIAPAETGSLYDFVDNDYSAPVNEVMQSPMVEQKAVRACDSDVPQAPKAPVREENWMANREPGDNKYNNKDLPRHVQDAIAPGEQKNNSVMAFWRLFTQQKAVDTFEDSVNLRFGGRDAIGALFREKKIEYVTLYKQIMNEYNSK